jgi:hypothetical protein
MKHAQALRVSVWKAKPTREERKISKGPPQLNKGGYDVNSDSVICLCAEPSPSTMRMARDESEIFTIGRLTLNQYAYVIFGGFHVVEDQSRME